MKSAIVQTLFVVSILLLIFTILGDTTSLGRTGRVPIRNWEQYDVELIQQTPNLAALERYAAAQLNGTDAQKIRQLYDIVCARFGHSEGARYNLFSNWILWGLGWLAEPAGARGDIQAIRNVDSLLRLSDHGLCSQVNYMLVALTQRFGYPSRHVGLNGHVTMEIFHDGAWRMYDPDFEVMIEDENGNVLGVHELETRPDLVDEYFTPHGGGGAAVACFTTAVDNTFVSYPPGAWFSWKAQVMTFFEAACQWLKYLVPLVGILIFTLSWRRPNRRGRKLSVQLP
ncbi:MAG: hypothetical protein P9L94_10150 [Candidatus Hinthialibacter antarcticus]|nr:hypothetical protein [Candidatus Hinthialibacter antarcticus]